MSRNHVARVAWQHRGQFSPQVSQSRQLGAVDPRGRLPPGDFRPPPVVDGVGEAGVEHLAAVLRHYGPRHVPEMKTNSSHLVQWA